MSDIKSLTDNIVEGKLSRDFSNDPTFKKRAEEAKAFLKKHGLYEKLTKRSDEKKQVDEPQ